MNFTSQLEKELVELLVSAGSVKVEFDILLSKLASDHGADVMLAPLKSFARAMEKVCADYRGDVSLLKDVVRGTLVVDTAAEAQHLLLVIIASCSNVTIKRNWLLDVTIPAPMYRDILVYVEVQGMVCELQINTVAMVQAKEYGHKLYEGQRTLVANASMYSDTLDADEFVSVQRLVRRQVQIYTDAWKRSQ